jgi:hypothetical protein
MSSVWIFLHSSSLLYNILTEDKKHKYTHTLLPNLIDILPCETCKTNYNEILTFLLNEHSSIKNAYEMFDFTVKIHNKINEKLNTPSFSTNVAIGIYTKPITDGKYDLIYPIEDCIWECFIYSSKFYKNKEDNVYPRIIELFRLIIELFYLPSMDGYFIFSTLKASIVTDTVDFCNNVRSIFYMHPYARITLNYHNTDLFTERINDTMNELLDIDFVNVTINDTSYRFINNNLEENTTQQLSNNNLLPNKNTEEIITEQAVLISKTMYVTNIDGLLWNSSLIYQEEPWNIKIKPFQRYIIYNDVDELNDYSFDIIDYIAKCGYHTNFHIYCYTIIPFETINNEINDKDYNKISNHIYLNRKSEFYQLKNNSLEIFNFESDYKYDIVLEFIVSCSFYSSLIDYITLTYSQLNCICFVKYTKGIISDLIPNSDLQKMLTMTL